ncbi:MAG: asparagine synthase-related protein, partial [Methanoregulaceae archaeon]|nr:asparagine synthase-related protein [Methanoregulaceae archaeon]
MVNALRFIESAIKEIQQEVGDERVVIALSGGVDSSVCAELARRAVGGQLVAIYVDTGLMRKG